MNPGSGSDRERPEQDAHPASARPSYSFAELSRGGKEVIIEHDQAEYRLRLTRNGKLILTK